MSGPGVCSPSLADGKSENSEKRRPDRDQRKQRFEREGDRRGTGGRLWGSPGCVTAGRFQGVGLRQALRRSGPPAGAQWQPDDEAHDRHRQRDVHGGEGVFAVVADEAAEVGLEDQ